MDLPLDTLDWDEIVDNAGDDLLVADLGCGEAEYHDTLMGAVSTLASSHGYDGGVEIYGVDEDGESLEAARENNPGDNFQYFEARIEDGGSYTPVDGEFDIVVSQHLKCEADNAAEISREVERLSKDSGYNEVHTTC
jgi:SAM-dependent methyltransferase